MKEPVEPRAGSGWTIHLDQRLTRRKTFALLESPDGEAIHAARNVAAMLRFVDDREEVEYFVVCEGDARPAFRLVRLAPQEKKQWQS